MLSLMPEPQVPISCPGKYVKDINWTVIDTKYPSKFDKDNLSAEVYRKERTVELYDYLPQTTLEERATFTDIRDAVIDLNYTFFGYIASHKFLNNSFISYEDKFQSALLHFCEMWEKYRFWGGRYRTDVAFGVFFKPRITECMERELDEVKYSLRRTLTMEVGDQIGKHWAKVTYEDLSDPRVKLSGEKMESLKAMFGSMYVADLETHAMFIESSDNPVDSSDLYSDNYSTLTDMLIHEMVERERKLTPKDVAEISELMTIPIEKIQSLLPEAEDKLYKTLVERVEINECFH